jgi:hypothetical protein
VLVLIGVFLIIFSFLLSPTSEGSAVGDEERTAELCSGVSGVGECRVAITYRQIEGESRVYAVAVLCQGAESASVRRDLTDLICSLYGIGANRVSILPLADEKVGISTASTAYY